MARHANEFFELSLDLLAVADFEGRYKYLNQRWETLGWTLEELTAHPFVEFVHPLDREKTIAETLRLVDGNFTFQFENRYRTKDGKYRHLSWTATSVQKKKLIYAIARDVTEQKEREENLRKAREERERLNVQLLQASKLSSLGTLGAGVAHELNNPLLAVKGYAQMIELSSEATPTLKNYAQEIVKASLRMQKIIDHLRTFGRLSKPEDKTAVKISDVVNDSLILLEKQLLYSGIKVEVSVAKDEPFIWGDKIQLESIFQNLLINSRDAFQEMTTNKEKKVIIKIENGGKSTLTVSLKDNATGIPSADLNRVFDPFFTTKEVGKGTGLGLSISHGVVKDHGGSIQVSSEVGKGTEFTIEFPVHLAKEVGHKEEKIIPIKASVPNAIPNLKWNILVVDDDVQIAGLLAQYLRNDFQVQHESNPHAALEWIKKTKYAAIITDLHMPQISGSDILTVAQQAQPGVPVIVISGHGLGDPEVEQVINQGAHGFIKKPFESMESIKKLLLDALMTSKQNDRRSA